MRLTPPFNLPAPGRCQTLYFASSAWQSPVFLVNSRLGRFSATPVCSDCSSSHTWGHPFFRSYGIMLPSSLGKTHSSTLGFSPHLRVSVYGTVTRRTHLEVFLGSGLEISLWPNGLPIISQRLTSWICLGGPPTDLDRDNRRPADPTLLRHPIVSLSPFEWYGNVGPFSISYAFRPRLRVRLTLSGLTLLRKPWVFGGRVSRPSSRYLCRHNHFRFVHRLLSRRLQPTTERSPTTPEHNRSSIRSFGFRLEPRELSAQNH